MTVENNDKTICTQKNYKGSGKEIKNSKCLTVINTKGNSVDFDLKAGLRSCVNNACYFYDAKISK